MSHTHQDINDAQHLILDEPSEERHLFVVSSLTTSIPIKAEHDYKVWYQENVFPMYSEDSGIGGESLLLIGTQQMTFWLASYYLFIYFGDIVGWPRFL